MSIALALCSMVCAAGNDLVFKQRAGSGAPPARHIGMLALVWTACFAIPACAAPWALGDPALIWGVLSGSLGVFANLLFLRALGGGEVGACATVYRLNLVPAMLLAVVLLDEAMTPHRLAAVAAALGAVVLLAGPRRGAGWTWLWPVLIACLARAGMGLAYKHGLALGADTSRLLFVNGVVWLLGAAAWTLLAERGRPAPTGRDVAWGALSGLLITGNVLFLALALARAPLSDVLPITQLGFVATALVAVAWFRERLTWAKAAALGLAVACILVLGSA